MADSPFRLDVSNDPCEVYRDWTQDKWKLGLLHRSIIDAQNMSLTDGRAHWLELFPHMPEWLATRSGSTSRKAITGHRSPNQRSSKDTLKGRVSGSEQPRFTVSTSGTPCCHRVVHDTSEDTCITGPSVGCNLKYKTSSKAPPPPPLYPT